MLDKSILTKFRAWSTNPFYKNEKYDKSVVDILLVLTVGTSAVASKIDDDIVDFIYGKCLSKCIQKLIQFGLKRKNLVQQQYRFQCLHQHLFIFFSAFLKARTGNEPARMAKIPQYISDFSDKYQ